jgi:hypothetical protein
MVAAARFLNPKLTLRALFCANHILQYVDDIVVRSLVNFVGLELDARHPLMHINSTVKTVVFVALGAI